MLSKFDYIMLKTASSTNADDLALKAYLAIQAGIEMCIRDSNITLKEDAQVLDEVVVTALGIKRSEKALSYNVQQVNADAVTTNKDCSSISRPSIVFF